MKRSNEYLSQKWKRRQFLYFPSGVVKERLIQADMVVDRKFSYVYIPYFMLINGPSFRCILGCNDLIFFRVKEERCQIKFYDIFREKF